MLRFDWATLGFQVINFLILLAALTYFLFRPLRAKLNERGRLLAEMHQRAREQEAEAARLRAEWEEQMRLARQRAQEIIEAAEQEASQQIAALMEEARLRFDRLSEQMRADLERQRDEIVAQHYEEILDTVITMAGHIVQSVTTRRTHDDLVINFCASIYQLPQAEVAEYRRMMADRTPVAFVKTPVPLTPEQNKTLSDTLSSLIDRHVTLQVGTDPSLVAGLQVRLGDRLIDNSIRQQLLRARERVHRALIAQIEDEVARG